MIFFTIDRNMMKSCFYFLSAMIIFAACFSAHAAEKKDTNVAPYGLEELCKTCYYNEAEDVAEILKNFDGDVNGKRKIYKDSLFGCTPLDHVVERGDAQMMQLLLEHGAKPTNSELHSLACCAKGKQFDTCFKLFIKYEADINARCGLHGNTPLHVSLPENIKKLVRAGADMRIKNDKEETPLYTFTQLFNRYDIGDKRAEKCIKQLLELGAPIDEYHAKAWPWLANPSNNKKMSELLLIRGEMSKNNDERHVQSLAFWALHALDKNDKIFCQNLGNVFCYSLSGDLLEKGIRFLVKKKQVFEVIDDINRHCPKDKLDRKTRTNIMSFVSEYVKTEVCYRLEDRFNCYWGAEEVLTPEKKIKIIREYLTSRIEYLEKRISKQIGFPGLYSGQHRLRIKDSLSPV